MTGTIPPLPDSLVIGEFSDNRFTGSLPTALPSRLTFLSISNNSFSGSIPQDWSLPEGLAELVGLAGSPASCGICNATAQASFCCSTRIDTL